MKGWLPLALAVPLALAAAPLLAGECADKPTPAEQTACLEARLAELEAEVGRLGAQAPAAGLEHPGDLDAIIQRKLEEALKPRLQPLQ